jgi:hypothetical protein
VAITETLRIHGPSLFEPIEIKGRRLPLIDPKGTYALEN